jgi:RNA polymerase sigma-70 factor (ECF subfamily)
LRFNLAGPDRSDRTVIAASHQLEEHRSELTAFCRRMLGSLDAEDAVQETFLRALRGLDRFERRGTLRAWLYRIATNVCYDVLESRKRRAQPMDLGPAAESTADTLSALAAGAWIEPRPGDRAGPTGDPAELTESRETVSHALAAALRYLPPRQRGVLILREVLRWKASEVAELLGTSVASVNSALQRARATLEARALSAHAPISVDERESELLRRYVRALERYDVAALTELVYEDAIGVLRPVGICPENMTVHGPAGRLRDAA